MRRLPPAIPRHEPARLHHPSLPLLRETPVSRSGADGALRSGEEQVPRLPDKQGERAYAGACSFSAATAIAAASSGVSLRPRSKASANALSPRAARTLTVVESLMSTTQSGYFHPAVSWVASAAPRSRTAASRRPATPSARANFRRITSTALGSPI